MLARTVFMLSAVYLAVVGFALTFFPVEFGRGAVPVDATPELISLLRLLGGPFLGIAVLNWRSWYEPQAGLQAIIIANLVGFGAVAANDIWGVASGQAREIAKAFLIVHGLFALAFLLLARPTRRAARPD